MSVNLHRNILVSFIVLALFLVSISDVNAAVCYVRTADCSNTICGGSESSTCKTAVSEEGCITSTDPVEDGTNLECELGCCCASTGYQSSATRGMCENQAGKTFYSLNPLSDSYTRNTECASKCGSIVSLPKYTLTGKLTYNGVAVINAKVTLVGFGDDTTDSNGDYQFYNVPKSLQSSPYTLTTTSYCGESVSVNLDSTKTVNLPIICNQVKISGTILKQDDANTGGYSITSTIDGTVQSTIITSSAGGSSGVGYYELTVPEGSEVSLKATKTVSGTTCEGVKNIGIVGSVNIPNQDIDVYCQKYTATVLVTEGGSSVTDAIVSTNRGNIRPDATHPMTLGYVFEDIFGGSITFTAARNKEYTSNNLDRIKTDCEVSSTVNLLGDTTINLAFSNSNCCIQTIRDSSCTNGKAVQTITHTGSCSSQGVTYADIPCSTEKNPCEWNYNAWSTCNPGDFEKTRTLKTPEIIKLSTCDETLQRPEPILTMSCGSESCGDGILDNSETCDYNFYDDTFNIDSSCIAPWTAVDPTITSYQDFIDKDLISASCNYFTCRCTTPADPDTGGLPACAITPSELTTLDVAPVENSYNFSLKWTIDNTDCTAVYTNHYVLKRCVDADNNEECDPGTEKLIDNNIAKDKLEYLNNGKLNPKILPNTNYCYNLSIVYDSTVAPGKTSSIQVCKYSGDAKCMAKHDKSWCNDNTLELCDPLTNKIKPTNCEKTDQYCWFDSRNSKKEAKCLTPANCDTCNAVFGIYSYMSYQIPTGQTIEGTDSPLSVYCPSYNTPNPNPKTTGQSDTEYIFGCYLDYSKTTINKIYDCKNVGSCYDYKSENACEEDYCSKFTSIDGISCEWNDYNLTTSTGGNRNKFGKGICAPKATDIENQNCELCNDQQYNRLGNACTRDVCQLFGKKSDGRTNCYFDDVTNECWNRNKVQCNWYIDENSCNGATDTILGKDVFTNVEWSLGKDIELTFSVDGAEIYNIKNGKSDAARNSNVRDASFDGAEIGVCKWSTTTNRCFRDADNSRTTNSIKDCRIPISSEEYSACEVDVINTTTTITPDNVISGIPIYGVDMNLKDQISIIDNNPWAILGSDTDYIDQITNWKYIRTFYCIDTSMLSPTQSECYPNTTLPTVGDNAFIAHLSKFGIPLVDKDNYILRYYSEDPARNLELVKTLSFKLDALAPAITETHLFDPHQISAYQWISDVEFTLKLIAEDSRPVTCDFTLTPQTPSAILAFAWNKNEESNLPGPRKAYNKITNINDNLKIKYYELTDGEYEYTYNCFDKVGNVKSETKKLIVDGDLRISDATPLRDIYNQSNITSGKITISVNTSNPGECRYSTSATAKYTDMTANVLTSTPLKTVLTSTSYKHSAIVDVGVTQVYKYYIACSLTDVNGRSYIVYGNDADNPYFSVDKISPITTLLHRDIDTPLAPYVYKPNEPQDGLILKLACNDNNTVLRTSTGQYLSFGCDNSYYCIPEVALNGNKCNDINTFTPIDFSTDNGGEIALNYGENSANGISHKTIYGNKPTIYYYSVDKGGNIENYNYKVLNLLNTNFDSPVVNYGSTSTDSENRVVTVRDIKTINYHAPLIFLKYDGETSITIKGFSVVRTDDNSYTSVQFDAIGNPSPFVENTANSKYSLFTYYKDYVPAGTYRLKVDAVDDDGNINNYTTTFVVNHTGLVLTLVDPILGIGTTPKYNIELFTSVPSDCRYNTKKLDTCNSLTSGALSCWYDSNWNTNILSDDGVTHIFQYDDSKTSDFISSEDELMTVTCKIRNTYGESNEYYKKISFHYGHLLDKTGINVTYKLDPIMRDAKYNTIINKDAPWITVKLNTTQPSFCKISMIHESNILTIPNNPFDGEESEYDFDSYKLLHEYFISYEGTGYDDGTSAYKFTYDITCTNLAQLTNTTTADVKIDFDTTPPVAGIKLDKEYLTKIQYNATCAIEADGSNHCTDKFQYKIIETGEDITAIDACIADKTAFSSDKLYDYTITIVQSKTLCIKVKDVLGRENIYGENITVTPFNKGEMSIETPPPFQYIYDETNMAAYSPTEMFDLIIRTGTVENPVPASCVYGSNNNGQFNSKESNEIYGELASIGNVFNPTGDVTHTIEDFEINTYPKIEDAWVVVCLASNIPDDEDPYIQREIYFFWDDTKPTVNINSVPKIYDWSNRLKTNITINTDDETMCKMYDVSDTLLVVSQSIFNTATQVSSLVSAEDERLELNLLLDNLETNILTIINNQPTGVERNNAITILFTNAIQDVAESTILDDTTAQPEKTQITNLLNQLKTDILFTNPTELIVDEGIDNVFESYKTNRVYSYNVPIKYYNNINFIGNIKLNTICTNRAKESINKNITIHYEIDKQINATTNFIENEANVFSTNKINILVNTDLISTCTYAIDENQPQALATTNRTYHSKNDVAITAGIHSITIDCGSDNNNIGRFTKTYEVIIDLTPPTIVLTSSDLQNTDGSYSTCSLGGFTVGLEMSDAESDITGYSYIVSGSGINDDGIVGGYPVSIESGSSSSITIPEDWSTSILQNNKTYTITVIASDQASHTTTKQIIVRTYNPATGVTCDSLGPEVSFNTIYHPSSTKNFATVNLTCNDIAAIGPNSFASGCAQSFKYSITSYKDSCSGATYSNTATYDDNLIFYGNGTLCVQAKDLTSNPTNVQLYVDVNPITCGNGVIEPKLDSGYFGLPTSYVNWNTNNYDSLLDEDCDGDKLNDESCMTQGFVSGALSCNPVTCKFDNSSCVNGQEVNIVSPLPFGIGNANPYTLTVSSQFESVCKYGSVSTSTTNIITAYNNAIMDSMTLVGSGFNHDKAISLNNNYDVPSYIVKYAICHMNNPTSVSSVNTAEKEYGLVKVYEGYDTTVPIIVSITTDKLNDTIIDFNKQVISIAITTNEDTVCSIKDSINTVPEYIIDDRDLNDYSSYSKTHSTSIDYTDIPSVPTDGLITLTVSCTNKAGLTNVTTKNIYYIIAEDVIITKIAPTEEYITNYVTTFSIKTNLESSCTINNGTSGIVMSASGGKLVHEKSIGLKYGWNTVAIDCEATGGSAHAAHAEYEIFAGANTPLNMDIVAQELSCSLASITAKLSASKTTLDISTYTYTVTDLATSVVICSGSTTTGDLTCSSSIADGRKYVIEAYAVDTANHASDHAFAIVTGSTAENIKCDVEKPVISISIFNNTYADIVRLNVVCSDTHSGCKAYYYYSLLDSSASCDSATYSSTKTYGTLDVTSSKNLCIKGYDNNNNYNTSNYSVVIDNTDYINLRPISETVSPKYIPTKLIVTLNEITNVNFKTDTAADCKYTTTTLPALTIEELYTQYTAFASTGNLDHQIASLDTTQSESLIDIICYADSLATNKYSRESYIITYINTSNTTLNVSVVLNPNNITDWYDRSTELTGNTTLKTVCTIFTNDGQHNETAIGNVDDYTTYDTNQYSKMSYDINTFTPSMYYYNLECTDYLGRKNNKEAELRYDLPTTLNITLLSPVNYTSDDINIIVSTNIKSECNLMLNSEPEGLMSNDVTEKYHILRLTNLLNGTYKVDITCNANIKDISGSISYNININTTNPATYCGDGVIQKPNNANRNEDCDLTNLNGKTCTKGFVGLSYTGGQLKCKNDCTFDFTSCDDGRGWCGNGKLEGPNSNGLKEECDGSVSSSLKCSTFGFKSGTLSCTSGCLINTTRCLAEGQIAGAAYSATCGNHQIESGESCEMGGNYTNILCKNYGYDLGTVSCGSNCRISISSCSFKPSTNTGGSGNNTNISNSNRCGNGVKDSTEECDKSATSNNGLSSLSCKLFNSTYTGGNVSCNNLCKIEYTSCTRVSLCNNTLKDSGETDIDCGGNCGKCTLNKKCVANSDCITSRCGLGVCVQDTCANNITDNSSGETDVDCGGSCDQCALEKTCSVHADCISEYCLDNKCAENPCTNGIKDGLEADIDCGGSCVLCSAGNTCNTSGDCSSNLCEEGICKDLEEEIVPDKNPAKLPLIIIGIILMFGSGGYIIYRTFYDTKPTSTLSNTHSIHSGHFGTSTAQKPTMTPEQQRAILEKQREALQKRRDQRSNDRKSFMNKLDDKPAPKKELEVLEEKPIEKKKISSEDSDEFIDIDELKDKKNKNREEIFNKLKEIGKDKSLPDKTSSNEESRLDHTNALKMFGNVDRDIVMSKTFREVLSKLLDSGKLSKENVSKILFEYMDKGMINKAEVAKISSELKII